MLLLMAAAFPVTRMAIRDPARREIRNQWLLHRTSRLFIRLMESLGLMRLEVRGGKCRGGAIDESDHIGEAQGR